MIQQSALVIPPRVRLELIYQAYRILLSLLLLVVLVMTWSNPIIGGLALYRYALLLGIYFVYSVISYLLLRYTQGYRDPQLMLGFMIDMAVLTAIMYLNDGPSLPVSMLYLVVVTGSSLILSSKRALVVVLLGVICVIYQQFWFAITNQNNLRGIGGALILVASFLGVGYLTAVLARRLQAAELQVERHQVKVSQLTQISQQVIERTPDGMIVIDAHATLLLCNRAAQRVLRFRGVYVGERLSEVSEEFAALVNQAIERGLPELLYTPTTESRLPALSVRLQGLEMGTTLLQIEPLSRVQAQAQQLKLASMGRLTASIAHEIRNPVAAISQASQLLVSTDNDPNQRLYKIIHDQTQRINRIIEDMLRLSKTSDAVQTQIKLVSFFHELISQHFEGQPVEWHAGSVDIIWFNRSQLEQILINLIQNAINHGRTERSLSIKLIASSDDGQIDIDVIDNGSGVKPADQSRLFDPFFTTSRQGTGLGLYLCTIFCQANGATLQYVPLNQGSCFKIKKINNRSTKARS